MKSKISLVLLSVAIVFGLFTGCSRQVCAPPPKEDTLDKYPSPSVGLNVDIFLDATLSMKGFVTAGTNSYFQEALPLLESAVISGWSDGKANFFKFGNDVAALQRREHLRASSVEFYGDPNYNTQTLIENVIDRAQTNHLSIIITDLFQNDADVNQLSNKLRDKYIAGGLALGVYAVKSQFNGSIYDVGPSNYSFAYKTDNTQPKTFRPFYLLALGSHGDIEKYFDALDQGGFNGLPAEVKRRVIFSPYFTASPVTFDNADITATSKISRLERGTLLPAGIKDVRLREFKIVGDADQAGFKAEMKVVPLRHVVEMSEKLEPDIVAWKCDGKTSQSPQGGQLIESLPAQNALTISNARLNSENHVLRFEAQIKAKALPGPGTYCYRIILRPATYQLPAWVSEWDLSVRQIDAARKNEQEFDGSRTYNLLSFLNTLWGATQDKHRPKVAGIYCYLQREK